MTFLQLTYFVTVARCGSITAAAEELMIEQPALSRSIRRLEDELNAPLFDRKGRAIVLNEAGRLFLDFAEPCLNSRQKVNDTIARVNNPDSGELLIGMANKSTRVYHLLIEFHRRYPAVHLTVKHLKSPDAAHDCDFAFALSDYETAYLANSFDAHRLWREGNCLMVSARNSMAQRESIRLNEAKDCTFILSLDPEFAEASDRLFEYSGFTPVSTVRLDDPNLVAYMVREDLAVALTPEFTPFCENAEAVRLLPLSDPEYYRHIFLYRSRQKRESRVRRNFYEFVMEACREYE